MAKEGCPGSREITNPHPEEIRCRHCGAANEIWSDEPEIECGGCGQTISRRMAYNCILWCPAARQCVGEEKYERLIKSMKGPAARINKKPGPEA
ncbi:MAG: hypothetical protein M0Z48_03430 [Nitrospiraceae bacterium]|nr:hypothetical protein [Nitrospiraceae bacterium]